MPTYDQTSHIFLEPVAQALSCVVWPGWGKPRFSRVRYPDSHDLCHCIDICQLQFGFGGQTNIWTLYWNLQSGDNPSVLMGISFLSLSNYLDLQKSCKNSTVSSLMVTSYVTLGWLSKLRNRHWYGTALKAKWNLITQLQTWFRFYQFFFLVILFFCLRVQSRTLPCMQSSHFLSLF